MYLLNFSTLHNPTKNSILRKNILEVLEVTFISVNNVVSLQKLHHSSDWLAMVNSLAQLRFFVVASLSVFEAAASQ